MNLKHGDKAPDFMLNDQDGNSVALADYRGKQIVLFFYPADYTPVCTKEACAFRDRNDEILKKGAQVLGISADSIERHKKFHTEHHLNYPILSDNENAVRRKYGAFKLGILPSRATFVIDAEGTIKKIFIAELAAEKHTEEALSALD